MSREYQLEPFGSPVSSQIDYAAELNAQQYAAVTALPNPALVIAGAGSGKTRTLTYRVAYLLEQGIPPDRILLLTFTNKAAREMMRRVNDVLGADISSLWGGTFHSIANRVLRRHAELFGYKSDFTILDREDTKDLLKACITDSKIDVTATRFPKPEVLGDLYSMAVNTQASLSALIETQYSHFDHLVPEIKDIAQRFADRKRASNVMDFDDLLAHWLLLLQKHEAVREQYQRRFQFILVDEYQDTNKLQSDIIDLLGARHHNVMVVGDDSQSIYSWRGAHFLNIMEFPKRYPNAVVYKIETNYRSTPEILAVANAAIGANVRQFEKELIPARKTGNKPILVTCATAQEQAAFVAQRALQLRDEGFTLNEMAVLYRSHFHALELQLELTRRNIPFSITSGIRFFEQAHVKDVAAYLRLANNPVDELSLKRLVRLLPGIGGKGAEKLWSSFREAVSEPAPADPHRIARALQRCSAAVPKKSAVPWASFMTTMAQLEEEATRHKPGKMIRLVMDAGYEDYLEDTYSNHQSRLEDLEQLASFALSFQSTEDFLAQLSLLSNVEAEEDQAGKADEEQIRLSTIHQAKGLEFSVVFIIMLCEGLFPSGRSLERPESEEEERRLFYVAITRAKTELYLSYPLMRLAQAYSSGDVMQQRSHFLDEIPKELLDEWTLRPFNPYQ